MQLSMLPLGNEAQFRVVTVHITYVIRRNKESSPPPSIPYLAPRVLDSAKWNLLFEFIKLEFQEWNWNIRIVLHWVIETSCLFGIVFLVQAFCYFFLCVYLCVLCMVNRF